MIYVVGLGPGDTDYLTVRGRQAMENSELLIGGKRNLEAFSEFKGEKYILGSNLAEMVQLIHSRMAYQNITVLASGDPLIYGIGKYLGTQFTAEELMIIPGISAIQYLFSKIPLDMNEVYITSSHGKTPDFDSLLAMKKVAMVTDDKVGPGEIAEEIIKRGLRKTLYIGENLSYETERVLTAAPEAVIGKKFAMNVVVIVDEKQ